MPAIVALGFEGDPLAGAASPTSFPQPLRREDAPRLVETIGAAIETEGHAIALYPEWAREPTLQRLETVRSALSTGRLALYGTSLPPLAAGAFASLAGAVAQYIPSPGVLLSALPRLESELTVMAWLRGVRRLRTPRPGLGLRLASMWPGSGYLAHLGASPAVRRVRRRGEVPVERRPELRLVVASRDGDLEWVRQALIPALGDPPVTEVEATKAGPGWWGTRRLVEIVGYPSDVPALAGRASLGVEGTICWWCDETVATDPCPFCGLDARLARSGAAR